MFPLHCAAQSVWARVSVGGRVQRSAWISVSMPNGEERMHRKGRNRRSEASQAKPHVLVVKLAGVWMFVRISVLCADRETA